MRGETAGVFNVSAAGEEREVRYAALYSLRYSSAIHLELKSALGGIYIHIHIT